MKLINPTFEIIDQSSGMDGVYKMIEKAGRTCYKSDNAITNDSAKTFVSRMLVNEHFAMLEHGTVYLTIPKPPTKDCVFMYDPYSKVNVDADNFYVTTNLRVLKENNWENDLKYLCEPTKHHYKRITVKFTLSRQIANEFIRHRVFSFAQESTRYCNYSKDKFNNELTFIKPLWFEDNNLDAYGEIDTPESLFTDALNKVEYTYMFLLKKGWKPQQAATILPNALKTELIMTGFTDDWEHFFNLRSHKATTGKPHPQAEELANPLMKEFKDRGYIKED